MLICKLFFIWLIATFGHKTSIMHLFGLQNRSYSCFYSSFPYSFLVSLTLRIVTGEEQAAVTIASVQQAAAFGDHNIQYQFRTESGQVRN